MLNLLKNSIVFYISFLVWIRFVKKKEEKIFVFLFDEIGVWLIKTNNKLFINNSFF